MWTHGPAFPWEKHRPGCQAQLLHPSPRLRGCEAVTGKAKHSRHAPGEEGSQDCGGQLNKMVCVKFSPATILLRKRMDPEVLSLSREDVLFYTSAAIEINILSKRSHLLN